MATKTKTPIRKGRPPQDIEHGTRKGYGQHLRRHEEACDPCKEAENEYQKEQRAIRVAEGRQKNRPYVPRVQKVRAYLDAALVDAFLRGRDDDTIRELRAELREWLDKAKEAHGDDLVIRSRDERNNA